MSDKPIFSFNPGDLSQEQVESLCISIRDLGVKLGIVDPDAVMNGPELVMLLENAIPEYIDNRGLDNDRRL